MLHTARWTRMLFIVALSLSFKTYAQQSIAGSYRLEEHPQPEGGTTLFLMPDSSCAFVYFGGARVGRWRVEADSLLYLTPTDVAKHPFQVYGRRHEGLGNRARIFYGGGFADRPAYVGLGASGVLRRVFNEDANCFSFPYVDTMATAPETLVFAHRAYEAESDSGTLYTFANSSRYNDFVVVDARGEDDEAFPANEPFAAVRRDGLLLIHSRYLAKRGSLPTGEDAAFIRQLAQRSPDPDSVLFNPRYRQAGTMDEAPPFNAADYQPAPDCDALVTKTGYEEGAEYNTDFDFHDMRILYLFRAMKPENIRGEKFNVKEPPLFRVECD